MRTHILLVIGLIALGAGSLYTWQLWQQQTLALASWNNSSVADGFWLHPRNAALQQALYVQQYEAEITNSYVDKATGRQGLELQDLRLTDLQLSLELPSEIVRGAAFESLPAESLDLILPLTPAETMNRLNRKGTRIRMLVAQELYPKEARFIETVNFLTVQSDEDVDAE